MNVLPTLTPNPRLSFLLLMAIAAVLTGSVTYSLTHRSPQSLSAAPIQHTSVVPSPPWAEARSPEISSPQPIDIPPVTAMADQSILTIDTCNGAIAHANFRSGSSQSQPRLGIVTRGTTVTLTGQQQGHYHQAIAAYWQGETLKTGTGWLHQCWLPAPP